MCHRCGRDSVTGKSAAEQAVPEPSGRALLAPAETQPGAAALILRKIIWTVALLVMGVAAIEGFFSFAIQTGAPQQAAAAAASCFRIITPYVIARALDELTRGRT
jgi:hypothetical protein